MEYPSIISGARSGVNPKVSSSTTVTNGAKGEGGEYDPGNIGGADSRTAEKVPSAKDVTCAEPSTGPTSTDCGRETLGFSANRTTGSVACPAKGSMNNAVLAKSWTKGEIRSERQSRSVAT